MMEWTLRENFHRFLQPVYICSISLTRFTRHFIPVVWVNLGNVHETEFYKPL